jgi:4-hydroxyphenylpyruvate dioxygenase
MVKRANRPNLGLILDSFHTFVRKNPVEPIAQIPGNRIFLVQVADSPDLLMDPLSLSRHYRCMPGQGEYPIAEFLQAVARSGYEGAISLEIFNEQFRGASTSQVATDGLRSLKWFFDRLNLPLSSTPSPREALPEVPQIGGLEFVEFSAGESDAQKLTSLFGALGFRQVGKHRSKEVKLFRQNHINFVLNSEPDSFAQNFYAQHGPSVCAVALKVDDSHRAIARANALGAQTHQGRIGPGEAQIPAVKGIEGSPIYFVDAKGPSNWDTDFVMDKPEQGGLLLRVDHLSNVVQRWEFLSWLLFYKSVLGFEEEPQVELADPYGAFYSRSVRSPDKSVRIPLNIGDGGNTAVSRFLSAFGGAGVQHIALETSDIFAFAAEATARGVRFLQIPPNYYDDLGARFGLEGGLLEKLREHNILFDRNQGGGFFQLYTSTFENRFFFEVVERRGYDLLGAANTPVRLAAQAREHESPR